MAFLFDIQSILSSLASFQLLQHPLLGFLTNPVVLFLVSILVLRLLFFPAPNRRFLTPGRAAGVKFPHATTGELSQSKPQYDVVIVGASISGTLAARQLALQGRKVCVITVTLDYPETIIGELLQPGGIELLDSLGLGHLARDAGVVAKGYCAYFEGKWVELDFPTGKEGVSFHHGDFVMNLRTEMLKFKTDRPEGEYGKITVIEGTAQRLVFNNGVKAANSSSADRVVGVEFQRKGAAEPTQREFVSADLTLMCDGGGSCLARTSNPVPHSHFVGVILEGVTLHMENRGNVILAKDGPILCYRLDKNQVRCLIDKTVSKLPRDMKGWLLKEILPDMPEAHQEAFKAAVLKGHKVKPHFLRAPHFPKYRGVVGIGDHGNVRHPLTGGGMTCAMRDAVFLTNRLSRLSTFADHDRVHQVCLEFLRARPFFTSAINLLSWALHSVFRGPMAMRTAVFAYFEAGGLCVSVPMSLLSALNNSLFQLVYHYCRTMAYGTYVCITGRPGHCKNRLLATLTFAVNPVRWFELLTLVLYSIYIVVPLAVIEIAVPWRIVDRTRSFIKAWAW